MSPRIMSASSGALTPLRAIRIKCLDCQGQSPAEVRGCPSEKCSLWPYRMGTNPARKGVGGNPKLAQKEA